MSTAEDIARVKRVLRERTLLFFKALVMEAHRRVVLRTPVDTGRARANWMLSTGSPSKLVREAEPGGSAATQMALDDALEFVKTLDVDDVAYIVNNLPYIERLENGWSDQAPEGMVSVTVEELALIKEDMIRQLESGRKPNGL